MALYRSYKCNYIAAQNNNNSVAYARVAQGGTIWEHKRFINSPFSTCTAHVELVVRSVLKL